MKNMVKSLVLFLLLASSSKVMFAQNTPIFALPKGSGGEAGVIDSSIYALDWTTGEILESAPMSFGVGETSGYNGMAFNPTDGMYYAIVRLNVGGGGGEVPAKISSGSGSRKLVTIDVGSPAIDSYIADLPNNASGIAITNDGTIYIITGTGGSGYNDLYQYDGDGGLDLVMQLDPRNGGSTIMYDSENDILYHFSGYISGTLAKSKKSYNKSSGLPSLNSNMLMEIVDVADSSTTEIPMSGDNMDEVFAGVYIGEGTFVVSSYDASLYQISTDGIVSYLAGPLDVYFRGFSLINGALPVELVGLDYLISESNVVLKWNTKSETNNYGWDVEKRENGYSNNHWTKVGFVSGSGTTTLSKSYQYSFETQSEKFEVRLKQLDSDGSVHYSKILKIENKPVQFEVLNNYPNPFNPITNISFNLPKDSNVKVSVFNQLGQEVAVLINDNLKARKHITVPFNGAGLSSGIYFYRITSDEASITKSMVLMK